MLQLAQNVFLSSFVSLILFLRAILRASLMCFCAFFSFRRACSKSCIICSLALAFASFLVITVDVGKVFIEFIGGAVYKSVAACRMNWFKRFLYEKKSVEEVRSWLSSMALEVVDSASALRKEEIDEVKARLCELDKVMAVRKEQEEVRLGFLEQAKQLQSELDLLKSKKESLVASPEYSSMKGEVVSAVAQRRQASVEVLEVFGPLQVALKSYAEKVPQPIVQKYAQDPLQAFVHDYSFGILEHVNGLRVGLETGMLGVRGESAQRALVALQLMVKEELARRLHKYANARKNEMRVQEALAGISVMKEFEKVVMRTKELDNSRLELLQKAHSLEVPNDLPARDALRSALERVRISLVP